MSIHGAQHVPNWDSLDVSEPPAMYSTGNRDAEKFRTSFRTQAMFATSAADSPVRNTGSPKKSPIKTLNPQGLYNTKEKHPEKFLGFLQPVSIRAFKNPAVNFEKGGSDFRCPSQLSSMGPQYHSLPHTNTQPRAKFPQQRRWINEKYRSPGPVYGGPSSIGKQVLSHTATAGGVGFGTSTRAGALKTYATYTV